MNNIQIGVGFSSDLFVRMSVFVKFIGFPKPGYLDITAVCHDSQSTTNQHDCCHNFLKGKI